MPVSTPGTRYYARWYSRKAVDRSGTFRTAAKKAEALEDIAWRLGGPLQALTRDRKVWLVDVYAALSRDGRYELEQTIHWLLTSEARELRQTGRLKPYGRYIALNAALAKTRRAASARAARKPSAGEPRRTRTRTA